MATTYTTNAALAKPAQNDRAWHVQLRDDLDQLDGLGAVGPLAVRPTNPGATTRFPSTTRNVNVAAGGYAKADGTRADYAGASAQAMPATATTRVWLTDAGVLTTGSGWPTTNHVRLASVTCDGTTITAIVDERTPWASFGATAGGAATYLPLAGGTLTGALTLAAAPTVDLHASTKKYVDDTVSALAGGAPVGASYVCLATNATLTSERVLTAGTGVTITDAGAGSTITLAIGQSVATTASPTFAGAILTAKTAPGSPTSGEVWHDSARKAMVINPGGYQTRIVGNAFVSTSDRVVANTTYSSALPSTGVGTLTFPADRLVVGTVLRVRAWMSASTSGTSVTLTMSLELFSAVIVSATVQPSGSAWTNKLLLFEGFVVVDSVGATGSASGVATLAASGVEGVSGLGTGATIDTTGDVALDFSAAWSVAASANTVTIHRVVVEVVN
jgi:hypothetical protein